jgi:hypothetical protein
MFKPPQDGGVKRDPESLVAELRRIRVCTPEEQQEFSELGKRLLENGLGEEELQTALGLESVESLRRGIENGRVTTTRLDRIRTLAKQRLGITYQAPAPAAAPERERAAAEVQSPDAATDAKPSPSAASHSDIPHIRPPLEVHRAADPDGARKEYLTKAQHRRLRDHIERLWAVDARFRNWSLLARAGGLSSGQAMKRAYEVGSSVSTLHSLETFCRLHAGFGSKATLALNEGVELGALREYLKARAETPDAADTADIADADPVDVSDDDETTDGDSMGTDGRTRARGRKKSNLTPEQHARLKTRIEELWERDGRLKRWSLLAKALGLGSAFAAKRAYDVNSSITTLKNAEYFGALQARFEKGATDALIAGATLDGLEAHLRGGSGRAQAGPPQTGTQPAAAPASPVLRPMRNTDAPPAVDFARMVELGSQIDSEVKRIWEAAQVFDALTNNPALPQIVRVNAQGTRDKLRSVVELWAGSGEIA